MVKVGILGATGYAGAELTRLLTGHSAVQIKFLDSRSYNGKKYSSVYPNLYNEIDMHCNTADLNNLSWIDEIDILFCALPHGLSQKAVKIASSEGKRVIDLSADFRISNKGVYEQWYGVKHEAEEELKKSVYGLCEVHREDIKMGQIIANPGCYPTSILLPLYPLLKEDATSLQNIIIDSKSGVSGAGRNPSDSILFSQCNENVKAYSIASHRHIPEIEEQLSLMVEKEVIIQFTPHLIPMTRGILSTIYLENSKDLKSKDIEEIFNINYKNERFIRLLTEGDLPQTKAVTGTNYCDIAVKIDDRTGRIIIISAIDNLIKGAAGQAVQNMNIILGFDEGMGLNQMSQWP
ncbi:N-acetyl-gamma-glutamyl-phosphate reductase [Alkaliphilus peptidifermentans]|uniref:N-acetyl-gamma-glutamyl-phosphate reductase n=1 Tax=Alkaliphilus peptidifermentans DSM 18978 TaxID=1120976 RepID=A0A1G5HNS2_9FIRM|nr:N-acetyl-gamma-glutamyl-phosphate reductase [Alkaliphilus peptidifermentans]SCY65426.1 N-acetyl-gamma-glutamyl-phosphate reductase [Alkaliphilus peptidifermentans DSM 18978]